ncbi:peptidylprolyl isomerase [Planctomyces sp. SH-PL62]|uniref:peptidylprolyl isomerase n=1 Tax=Planctomyces sp. SH-PL62 TaxID=1636152 RepID=UPI00078DB151|nr:Peptidyl-prolyl cis-trans isomerase A precursor [Planctomyces sp. SH-PL62]
MISTTLICGMILGLGACLAFSTPAGAQGADENPRVEIDTTEGKIVVELDAKKAPKTVENFLKYVDDGFYSNLIFHRVISGFMIQGGGHDATLREKTEGVRAAIPNESSNGLSNKRGTIAMARQNNPNSATCQFYINHADNAPLDTYGGGYTVFGKVVEGMDVVDAIAKTPVQDRGGLQNVPVKPITITGAKRVKP